MTIEERVRTVCDFHFPSGMFYTAAEPVRQTRDLGDGRSGLT
jgi:hypothetical protein